MVPWTTVPFLSSIETVSLFSFIKNLIEMNRIKKYSTSEEGTRNGEREIRKKKRKMKFKQKLILVT